MSTKNIVILILVGFLLIFLLQNTQVVEVRFLLWKVSMSRALMLFVMVFVGFFVGWLLTGLKSRKHKG